MKVKLLKEAGFDEALLGMALSYYDGSEPLETWWDEKRTAKAKKRISKLAHIQGGHNKAIEHIEIWMLVNAPLSWWKHADTYRVSSKQSDSTMHTLKKRIPLDNDCFSESTHQAMIRTNRY